ncbi:MAG: transcriptional regulator [Nanopusillaceae archaeon]
MSVIFLNNFLLAAMHRDKVVGLALMAIGVAGILIYGWLVFLSPWQFLILQLTAFIAVAAVLGILAWVGYALATTPPPKPIEEIEREVQKALEEIERQMKEESSQQASQ